MNASKKKPQPTYNQQRQLHYERVWQVKNPKLGNLSSIKEPTAGAVYTSKLDQVAYPKPGTAPAEIAAAKKQKEEDKKFNENFEREYGDKANKNYVRAKVNKNLRAGKAPYEDIPSSYLIVGKLKVLLTLFPYQILYSVRVPRQYIDEILRVLFYRYIQYYC